SRGRARAVVHGARSAALRRWTWAQQLRHAHRARKLGRTRRRTRGDRRHQVCERQSRRRSRPNNAALQVSGDSSLRWRRRSLRCRELALLPGRSIVAARRPEWDSGRAQSSSARTTSQIVSGGMMAAIAGVQVGAFILCGACLFMVGFDWQAMGYVAPAIVGDLNIPNSALGPVFGAANVGFSIGAVLAGMLADKIGRRPVLIGATVWFAVATLFVAGAASVRDMLALRFLPGIGFGSVVPTVTALAGEYSSPQTRITTIMVMTTPGMNGGAITGGLASAWLIPRFGWPAVFYVGGAAALCIGALMFSRLPESMPFLVLRTATADSRKGVHLGDLFREGRAAATTLLWILNFMNLLIVHLVASWLPTVVREAGYSISAAVLIATVFQIGGVIGTFTLAWLIG